jgi:AraC-like DNA-binding protein
MLSHTARHLPSVFDHALSSATMVASRQPFYIAINESDRLGHHGASTHWHDTFEIGYVLEGRGVFILEDQEFSFCPGQVHVVNAGYRHMAYAFDRARFFNVHFHPSLLQHAGFPMLESAALRPFTMSSQYFEPLLPDDDPRTERIIALLRAIEVEYTAAKTGWPLVVHGLILQAVGALLRHFLTPGLPDGEMRRRQDLLSRVAPALRLLEERLHDPPSLEELASAVALSPSYFGAVFREVMGSSPVAYRNTRRIALARAALSESDESIAAIADRCGFATVQQFNRVFLRVAGCTPSVYRARARLS